MLTDRLFGEILDIGGGLDRGSLAFPRLEKLVGDVQRRQ